MECEDCGVSSDITSGFYDGRLNKYTCESCSVKDSNGEQ